MAEEKRIEELSFPILLAEQIRKAVEEAELFKVECSDVGKQVERLSQMLRFAIRFATSTPSLYERPVRCIFFDVTKNLERALTLVRKCKHSGLLSCVVTITSATDFRKSFNLLDASIGDMKWLLSIFDSVTSGGIEVSLPPIANNDPILPWVWSFVASIQMGPLPDRVEAANQLALLAIDNDRNKKIIGEEGGIPPLLRLLKEGASPDAQIAAATALLNLATNQERVRIIARELGIPVIVQVLFDSSMRVQIGVANLVARMAEHDPDAQEEFARENAIRPLVSLLSIDVFLDETNHEKPSIQSIVQNHKQKGQKPSTTTTTTTQSQNHSTDSRSSSSSSLYNSDAIALYGHQRKDRENEKPEVKLQLKISCAKALWVLSNGSVSNSRRITETKGLLCLAKLIEKEQGELQEHCLMTVVEITAAAESNADLRHAAFKTNSPPAKAVVEQLLRVIGEVSTPSLQIAAIKSIGSLARIFPARETRVIRLLVTQLNNRNNEVATEAVIALGKFACPENFLCVEHSKTIVVDGVPPLMKLLRTNEWSQFHGLTLLCYLALHVGNSEALERARALTVLEGAVRSVPAQNPSLKELISKAMYRLEVYRSGIHPHRHSYAP
ncbi:uncharacterized protein LOC122672781 [Telopea speciosissima]|uniref:uncharacterized protein LOC122672781 n=1 Tax=Telopea speciosissima TaxID=54955 RepID=UPI001CC653A7|nr:uncharacterized protein LOC122672781 [Telopea speciosissima]